MLVIAWVLVMLVITSEKKDRQWFDKTYCRPSLGATIAGNLLSWVLKAIYSHKMIKNDICWRDVDKQNASFLIK